MRTLWILLLTTLLPHAAWASTLAVLPLGMGAGSEEYEGLGTGLAGMMIADLTQVQTLRLVERERLDDLMKEFTLNDTGFVDPATAQRLGKGVGAELILTGSFSVVRDTITMDSRIIRVETADIVKAASASGSADDFVSVEKELVEQLLDGLDVTLSTSARRKLLIQTPTESFGAFADYGVGLKRTAEGKVEEAKAAYQKAVQADPEFVAAREALTQLRTLVEDRKAQQISDKEAKKNAMLLAAISQSPDPRQMRGSKITDEQIGLIFTRWVALLRLQRHCQRYEEMQAYAKRLKWRVGGNDWGSIYTQAVEAHISAGMFERQRGSMRENLGKGDYFYAAPYIFSNLENYLWELSGLIGNDVDRGDGLLHSMERCLGPAEEVAALEELQRTLESRRVLDAPRRSEDDLPLRVSVELQVLYTKARNFGASPEIFSRAEAVTELAPDNLQSTMTSKLKRIEKAAEGWERRKYASLGLTDEEAEADTERIAAGEFADDPQCAALLTHLQEPAKRTLDNLRKPKPRAMSVYDRSNVVIARRFGCLAGHTADLGNVADAYAFVKSARTNARSDRAEVPDCVEALSDAEEEEMPDYPGFETNVQYQMTSAWTVLRNYYTGVVRNRCVEVPWM
ncbi:MAG: CsgG/HfaB family protein [Myxococcales bacterium]|nr:CsgG/HfaB family protein [Myxococcales bacterium]